MPSLSWPWSRNRESFSSWSVSDPAFAAWLRGDTEASEIVTPYTVLGLSAVIRSVSVISTTIAGLPLRSYERQGDDRARVPSVFDDPYPGIDGMTRFAWVETILIHLLLWRNAYLWHESFDSDGNPNVYRPLVPDVITKVERIDGRKRFTYRDADKQEHTVGSEQITHIPGPSIDGVFGHPFLTAARAIFSSALSGDKAAQTTLAQGIRLAGLLTPADKDTPSISDEEGESILTALRTKVLGSENAGDIAFINRRLKLDPWTPTNVDSQWHETRTEVLGEIGRLFGMPPHLLNDTEKQTSWGTGVAEQNLGLARFTLMGWSTRIDELLSLRLPADQFCEFDYRGLLQGTPAEEAKVVIEQLQAGLLSLEAACKILNLPAPNAAQKRVANPTPPAPAPTPIRQEATA